MNPYAILGLEAKATREEICTAYRKNAIKYHPDRNNSDEAPRLFAEYSEAYEILIQPKFRAAYDQDRKRGLDELKFKPSDPCAVFFNFFGSSNPFDFLLPSRNAAEFAQLTKPKQPIPNDNLELELQVPLPDFVFGNTRMISGVRRLQNDETEEVQLACKINPGMADGSKIIFPKLGHADHQGSEPGDAIVSISTQPHAQFKRSGNDLIYTQTISLVESLVGTNFTVPLMDGRILSMHLTDIASPGYKICVPNEGIPIWNERDGAVTGRGSLYIEFEVAWPANRSDKNWEQMMNAFSKPPQH